MEITLTTEESLAVQRALRTYGSDLRMEIADTDNPSFRRELKAERLALESVVTKLDAAAREEPDATGHLVLRLTAVWTTA